MPATVKDRENDIELHEATLLLLAVHDVERFNRDFIAAFALQSETAKPMTKVTPRA
ncbi:hypothetical protein [Bradyrhizobium vignae]|uniref:hypothetical protein n=1 Tax=Bradyrhizobium vignae TaxID=1549949 RepID=UPI001FD805DA|nr:hypothetical protein [Bradyrhizobium vignae]